MHRVREENRGEGRGEGESSFRGSPQQKRGFLRVSTKQNRGVTPVCGVPGSNWRPPDYETDALVLKLPTELLENCILIWVNPARDRRLGGSHTGVQ